MKSKSVVLAVLMLAACATQSNSGFLTDYSRLRRAPQRGENVISWEKPGLDLRVYDRLMIDPVAVWLDPDSEAVALGDDALREVAAVFTKILRERIEPYYTLVKAPGHAVLRVRIAITDVAPAAEGAPADTPKVDLGGAAMEAEIIDAMTGEQLAAVVDRLEGSAAFRDAPSEWRAVEGAFIEWANGLLDYLDSYNPERQE